MEEVSDRTFEFLASGARRYGLFDLAVYYEECRTRVFDHRGHRDVLHKQAYEIGVRQLDELSKKLVRYLDGGPLCWDGVE